MRLTPALQVFTSSEHRGDGARALKAESKASRTRFAWLAQSGVRWSSGIMPEQKRAGTRTKLLSTASMTCLLAWRNAVHQPSERPRSGEGEDGGAAHQATFRSLTSGGLRLHMRNDCTGFLTRLGDLTWRDGRGNKKCPRHVSRCTPERRDLHGLTSVLTWSAMTSEVET